jgi:hypothetical protein
MMTGLSAVDLEGDISVKLTKKKHWIWFGIITIIFAAVVMRDVHTYNQALGVFWHRFEVIGLVYVFVSLHCFLDISKMYNWIYKHRIIIAIGIFVFMVANCFTLSSVSMYNSYIQPNNLSQYSNPIFGTARGIRSDEWLVSTPRLIAGSYNNYGATNDIVRGTLSSGITATSGYYFDYSALRSPASYGYYFFGPEYGNSFAWNFQMIFGALLTFELFMILTKKNKLYSCLGCALVWFSSYNMWWSISSVMFSSIAIIVFFYYMIKAEGWKFRLLFGTMLAIAGADFVTILYPAWQVPFGWLIIAIFIWILAENQEWKKYRWLDWLIIAADIVFMATIIIRFIQVDGEYLKAVTETVYPGKRITYGGYSLDKLLGYAAESLMPLIEVGNASESGTFFAAFPLGLIASAFVLKKEKCKNLLIWCILVPTVVYLIYCTVSLPPIVAKILMLTNSTPARAVDVLGFCMALLTIVSLSEMDECGRMKPIWAIVISAVCAGTAIWATTGMFGHNTVLAVIVIAIIAAAGIAVFISKGKEAVRKTVIIITSILLTADALIVHPITVGFSAITQKPLYSEVRSIIKENTEHTLWIGTGIVNGNYLIACGAPALNSTNFIPNKDLWKILDPNNENEMIWNRYAHLNVSLSDEAETTISLEQEDVVSIALSINDFRKLGVNYILSSSTVPASYQEYLEQIYSEDGSIIYHVK